MYRQPNNPIYRVVVVVWLTLSIASVVLAAATWIQLSGKLAVAREAVAVQAGAERILRLVVDCETGQRGYSLTGDEKFLEPFQAGESSLVAEFEALVELTRHEPRMLRRVIELRAQTEIALERLHTIVTTRKTRGMAAAAEIVADGQGRKMMERIRALAAEIRAMRSDVVSDNGAAARSQLLRASLTSLVAGVIGIGAGLTAFWLSRVILRHQQRERKLVEAKLLAERNSQEKTVFLANMSHEIRTPMNAILGFGELLDGELTAPRQRQYVQSIRSSATSLLQLINDILDMSKIEAGVMELCLEPTDPREVCDFLHTVFSQPAAKKSVKLECKVAEDLPHALLLDRIRLRQVLVNLVGNAVKFTDHGSIHVRVQWEKQPTSSHITLIIEVQDTGVGIPADKLEAIFHPFVQAGAHREKEQLGTGLGLAIVKRLTETMGGTVTAVSALGQGSAFHLRFPDVAISARLSTQEKLEPAGEVNLDELRPSTILVVDDNETNCQLVAGMFAGSHHKLAFGANGQEAVAMAREIKPEAILMDVRMPVMDGREALEEIRKVPGLELTPIIAVTASSLISGDVESKARFSGYVRKPFSKRELFDELAQFLPRQKAPPSTGGPAEPTPVTAQHAPPELVAQLRRLLEDPWPALRDSLAINECKAFAATLDELGQRWPCPPLLAFAQAVARHAENYSILELEQQLNDFPALVNRLERNSP